MGTIIYTIITQKGLTGYCSYKICFIKLVNRCLWSHWFRRQHKLKVTVVWQDGDTKLVLVHPVLCLLTVIYHIVLCLHSCWNERQRLQWELLALCQRRMDDCHCQHSRSYWLGSEQRLQFHNIHRSCVTDNIIVLFNFDISDAGKRIRMVRDCLAGGITNW